MGYTYELQQKVWKINDKIKSYGFTLSPDYGLHLMLSDVVKESPAWRHGLRPGDTIVSVNGWMITMMDKPEVGLIIEKRLKYILFKTR